MMLRVTFGDGWVWIISLRCIQVGNKLNLLAVSLAGHKAKHEFKDNKSNS